MKISENRGIKITNKQIQISPQLGIRNELCGSGLQIRSTYGPPSQGRLDKKQKKQQANNKTTITNKYKDKVKTEANIKENSIK